MAGFFSTAASNFGSGLERNYFDRSRFEEYFNRSRADQRRQALQGGSFQGTPMQTDVGFSSENYPDTSVGVPAGSASGPGPGSGYVSGYSGDGGYLGDLNDYYKQGKGDPKSGSSSDPVGAAVMAPIREARARYLGLMPRVTHIGSSYGGGHGGAERAQYMDTYEEGQRAQIANKLRKNQALGSLIQNSVGLVKDIACMAAGGAYCSAAKMATAGQGGGGGGGQNLGAIAGIASNYMGSSGGGGGGMSFGSMAGGY